MGKEFDVNDEDMAAIVAVISDSVHNQIDGPLSVLHEKAEESVRQLKKMKKLVKKVREASAYDNAIDKTTDAKPDNDSSDSDSDSDLDSDDTGKFIPKTKRYKDVQTTSIGKVSPYTGQQKDPYAWFKSMYAINKAQRREEGL